MTVVNVLGESAVRSLALALAVAVVLRLLRIQHARMAKRAWTGVMVLALAMPALVALHIPSFQFTALWSTPRKVVVHPAASAAAASSATPTRSTATFEPASLLMTNMSEQSEDRVPPPVVLRAPIPAELQATPAHHIAWWQIGLVAYVIITAFMLFRVMLGLALAVRLWRRAQPFATHETEYPVRLSVDLRSPATVGHGILLPLEALEWDDAALRATLAHESEHIREGDFYLQLAATIHLCFFWISPHAWWLRPQLSRLSETICDRAAVTSSGDGLSYAQLLIRFASAERTPVGMLAMAQSASLRERVERLIADPQLTGAFRLRRGQALCVAVLFVAAAVTAAATVHLVQPVCLVLAASQAPVPPPSALEPPSDPDESSGQCDEDDPVAAAPAPPDAVPSIREVAPLPGVHAATPQLPVKPSAPVPPTKVVIAPGETLVLHASAITPDMIHIAPLAMVHPLVMTRVRPMLRLVPQVDVVPTDENSRGYAIYGANGDHTIMHSWDTDDAQLRETRAKHPNGAILFERDGKTWIIDDPALVKQAQEAYAPVNELGKKQGELGARQGELGAQQGHLGELQGQLGELQAEAAANQWGGGQDFDIEMPKDFDKTVQALTDSEMRLAFERDEMSQEQIATLEAQQKEAHEHFEQEMQEFRAQQPQRDAMEKQMRDQVEQMRKKMEPIIKQMREEAAKQGELGRLQGELGRQQASLAWEQSKASREADSRVRSIIDKALKDGTAHPVQ